MKDFTNEYRYEDEYKFVLNDETQQNEIIEFIHKNPLPDTNCDVKDITQQDSYFDDENLTLHYQGITLRLRNHNDKFSLSLKKRIPEFEKSRPEKSIYQRMKEKEEITSQEARSFHQNGYIDRRCLHLLSAIAPNHGPLTEKVKIKTNRKIILLNRNKQKLLETHFDEMAYSINGHRSTKIFYEMEIEPNDFNEDVIKFIDKIQEKFNLKVWTKSKYDRGVFLYKRKKHSQKNIEIDAFKNKFNISNSDFDRKIKVFDQNFKNSGLNALNKIYNEYVLLKPYIEKERDMVLDELKNISFVHSIRSRVKDPEHLIEKLLRKSKQYFEGGEKLTETNFNEHITDLIGIRILHLYKTDWQIIDDQISNLYKAHLPQEKRFHIRTGDELQGLDRNEIEGERHFKIIEKASGCLFR